MRQHQLASLCREREWDYRLMGAGFDGANVPTKNLPHWDIRVEFYVDLPSDRKPGLHDSGLGEQSGAGINLFVGSDQVRFYRNRREIAVDDVPSLVYSEVMRDVDLFTSVCAVGQDETWSDEGDRGIGILPEQIDLPMLAGIIALRAEVLSRTLPRTPIADRCSITGAWLRVQGQLATYLIQLAWATTYAMFGDRRRHLKIPPKLLQQLKLDLETLPVELDHRSEQVLRTAYLLADDWKITSPELIQQLVP